jgi:YHS domain-containing protein
MEKRMRRRNKVVTKSKEVNVMAKDPICGMEVSGSEAAASLEYKGKRFHFCSLSCYDAFKKDPERYLISEKQGWWGRFLNRLAKANQETYGGKAPKCH